MFQILFSRNILVDNVICATQAIHWSFTNDDYYICEVARRQARKAFLALSSDAGSESKLIEKDTGKDLDLPADDEDRFYKTVPVRFISF